jgi:O-antigen/teichoic acid export membrane protein
MRDGVAQLLERMRGLAARDNAALQTVAAFGIKVFGAIFSFSFNFLMARHFGPTGIGQYSLAITTLTICSTISLVGMDYILIRRVSGDVKFGHLEVALGTLKAVSTAIFVNAIVATAVLQYLIIPVLANLKHSTSDLLVLKSVVVGVLPFALMRVVSSGLRATGKVLLAQSLDGPFPMLMAVSAMLVLLGLGRRSSPEEAALIYVASMAVSVSLGAYVQLRIFSSWPRAEDVPIRPILAQGWRILLAVLSNLLVEWVIIFTLAASWSTEEVGRYRAAWLIASTFNLLVVAFDAVSGPRIAAAFRRNEIDEIGLMWRQSVVVILVLASPLLLVSTVFPRELLGLFGSEFERGPIALRILIVGQVVNLITGPVGSILIMTGRERWSLAIAVGGLISTILLAVIFIPMFGLTGAAVVSTLSVVLQNLCTWVIAYVSVGVRFWRQGPFRT